MTNKNIVIDEKARVPITWVVGICGTIAAGAFWLAMLTSDVSNATIKNKDQDEILKEQVKLNEKISNDLVLIKEKLKIKD